MQKETINNLYVYIVLVITLIISIVGLARVVDTSLALLVDTSYRTAYSEFVRNIRSECSQYQQKIPTEQVANFARLSKSECSELDKNSNLEVVENMYNDELTIQKENEMRNKLSQLLRSIPWFIVPLPFFFLFNRMRKQK